ncbi:MAG: class I SAM-dependent methyltransferase [Phycisphaerae bacterium]|nr:class I SAM-dependent methyltransferase [Phycisphaerae bacterium]
MPPTRWTQPTTARRADRWDLYEHSVQSVEHEVGLVDRVYRRLRGRPPRSLREDFCGTALSACQWVRHREGNTAVALDIDPGTIAQARERSHRRLTEEQRSRLTLLRRDVRSPGREGSGVDVVLAMNFSYWVFKTRPALLAYFRAVRRSLAPRGVLFLDHFGGWAATREQEERTRYHRFTYVWDQHRFNPITNGITCFIHFEFRDGTVLRRAFRYDWRVWTIPETRGLLHEAGFRRAGVLWEGTDRHGRGNGVFRPASDRPEACESFVAYLVAEK